MEPKKRGRPPKHKNKESPTSIISGNNNNTNVNNKNPKTIIPPRSAKTAPPGYYKCKHKHCHAYCENQDILRRHEEDFKYHRRHYQELGDNCRICLQLATQLLWQRIISYRELTALSRDLLKLVETTRNTPPTLSEQ